MNNSDSSSAAILLAIIVPARSSRLSWNLASFGMTDCLALARRNILLMCIHAFSRKFGDWCCTAAQYELEITEQYSFRIDSYQDLDAEASVILYYSHQKETLLCLCEKPLHGLQPLQFERDFHHRARSTRHHTTLKSDHLDPPLALLWHYCH